MGVLFFVARGSFLAPPDVLVYVKGLAIRTVGRLLGALPFTWAIFDHSPRPPESFRSFVVMHAQAFSFLHRIFCFLLQRLSYARAGGHHRQAVFPPTQFPSPTVHGRRWAQGTDWDSFTSFCEAQNFSK